MTDAAASFRRITVLLAVVVAAAVLPVGTVIPDAAAAPVQADCGDGEALATGVVAGQAQGTAAGILGGGSGELINSQLGAFENINDTFGRCAGEAGLGGASGEPHLITQDRLTYDFHGRGDYVLLRSVTNDIEIQARFRRAGMASFLDAVAFSTATTTVSIEDLNHHATPIISLNGEVLEFAELGWYDLDNGLLFRQGKRAWAYLDNGLIIEASRSGLSLFTPKAWAGSFVGLLGNGDGDPSNDVATAAGIPVDPTDYDSLYGAFLDSWYVSAADSMMTVPFDETVDGPIRPEEIVTIDDLDPADVDAAREVCVAAGLEPGAGLEGCVFDIALTGDPIWAEGVPRAALGPLSLASDVDSATEAATDLVDADLGEDTFTSIAVSGDGTVHLSYHDDQTNYLMYATKAPLSSTWQTEIVDGDGTASTNTNVGDPNAIAVNGAVHILYYERSPNDLNLAVGVDGTWTLEPVDDSGDTTGVFQDLAIADDGALHAAYYDTSNGDLRYAFRDVSGSWHLQAVDTVGDVGKYTSVAVDNGAEPDVHIAYYDTTNDSIKYAVGRFDAASGGYGFDPADRATVDVTTTAGRFTDIAIDNAGRAHISYVDDSSKDVKHAWRSPTDGVWTVDTAASNLNAIGELSTAIVIGTDDRVHIAYRSEGPTGLALASAVFVSESYVWTTQMVDESAGVGAFVSMAVGPAGTLHFAYQDTSAAAIRYTAITP